VSEFWKLVLHPDQTVPGALLVVSLRHVAKVGELDEHETLEFFALYRLIEAALESELGASMVNLSCLRNWAYRADNADPPWLDGRPNPHVHWHVAPRYAQPVTIAGDTFVDERFGEELIWCGGRVRRDVEHEIIDRLRVYLGIQ
jgi:diadenosine tetraphosphate (Ap4A) HIT family hydrolase